jgi:hypothetical protein
MPTFFAEELAIFPYITKFYVQKWVNLGGNFRLIDGPPGGNYWRVNEAKFKQMDADNRIW